jgi:hypothetical protein
MADTNRGTELCQCREQCLADSELDAVALVEEEHKLVHGNEFFDLVEARLIALAYAQRRPKLLVIKMMGEREGAPS